MVYFQVDKSFLHQTSLIILKKTYICSWYYGEFFVIIIQPKLIIKYVCFQLPVLMSSRLVSESVAFARYRTDSTTSTYSVDKLATSVTFPFQKNLRSTSRPQLQVQPQPQLQNQQPQRHKNQPQLVSCAWFVEPIVRWTCPV